MGFYHNAQRKLLTHFLKQISLFSNIDESTVDVSLGANSTFTFTDVDLTVDGIDVPYFVLKSGSIDALTLQLSLSGSIEIIASGIRIVSSYFDSDTSLSGDIHNEATNTMKVEMPSIPVALVQSIHALTNSISETLSAEGGPWVGDEIVSNDASSEMGEDIALDATEDKGSSTAFGALKSKLFNVMLSNITITLFDIQFNVTNSENETIGCFELDKCTLLGSNTCWQLTLDGLKTEGIIAELSQEIPTMGNHFRTFNARDNGMQDDEDEIQGSHLSDSIYFSKFGDTSVYMSALDEPMDALRLTDRKYVDDGGASERISLFEIDEMRASFKWLASSDETQVADLCIDVDNLRINLDGILEIENPEILAIVKHFASQDKNISVSKVGEGGKSDSKDNVLMGRSSSENYENGGFLDYLSHILVQNVEITLSRNLQIEMTEITLNRSESGGQQMKVEAFNIKSEGQTVFKSSCGEEGSVIVAQFSNYHTNFDILQDFDILLSQSTFFQVIQVGCRLRNFLRLTGLKKPGEKHQMLSHSTTSPDLRLTTRDIRITLDLPDLRYSIKIGPLKYNSKDGLLQSPFIGVSKSSAGDMKEFISLKPVTLTIGVSETPVKFFVDTFEEIILHPTCSIALKEFKVRDSLESLLSTYHDILSLIVQIDHIIDATMSQSAEQSSRDVNNGRRNPQGVTFSRLPEYAPKWAFFADTIEWEISDLLQGSKYGNLKGVHRSNQLIVFNGGQKIVFHSKSLSIDRLYGNKGKRKCQSIVSPIRDSDNTKPSLFLKVNISRDSCAIEIYLRNISISYYARWMDFLQDMIRRDFSKSQPPEGISFGTDRSSDTGAPRMNSCFSVDVKIFDSSVCLFPYRIRPCLLVVINNLTLGYDIRSQNLQGVLKSATLMMIDDIAKRRKPKKVSDVHLAHYYSKQGFAVLGKLGRTDITLKDMRTIPTLAFLIDHLELALCPDSFYTLVQVCSDLKYPESFPDEEKFKLQPRKIVNIFDEIDPHFFNSQVTTMVTGNSPNQYEQPFQESTGLIDNFIDISTVRYISPKGDDSSVDISGTNSSSGRTPEPSMVDDSEESLRIQNDYIDSVKAPQFTEVNGHVTNHLRCKPRTVQKAALKLRLAVENASIKLYDGFDWKHSRAEIERAIEDLERGVDGSGTAEFENEGYTPENVTLGIQGKSLFDSIFITAKQDDPHPLKYAVNEEIQGNLYCNHNPQAASSIKANLHPSRTHKVEIKSKGIKLELSIFSVEERTEETTTQRPMVISDMSLLIDESDLIDNVPTSTWNKFLTQEHKTRHLPILRMGFSVVRPLDYLKATELIFDLEVSPLRLYIDQETLDFVVRFVTFKDSRFELVDRYPELPFIQRFRINPVKLRLDFKPKNIEKMELRSTYASKLMTIFVLDGASIELKEISLHGLSGFRDLGSKLLEVWTPDIIKNQAYGVLGGVAPLKSFVTLGTDIKTFADCLTEEYKVSGTISSSLRRNGQVFLRSTAGNLVNLGTKLVTGTQNILEGTEGMLGGKGSVTRTRIRTGHRDGRGLSEDALELGPNRPNSGINEVPGSMSRHRNAVSTVDESYAEILEDYPRRISLYANQPRNVQEGLGDAYISLGKHINMAYGTIKSTRMKLNQSDSLNSRTAIVSVAKVAPIVAIRPLIGATEALSKTLQGLSNQIDRSRLEEIRDKYKGAKSYS